MTATPFTRDDPIWSGFNAALDAAGLPTTDLDEAGQAFVTVADGRAFGGYALSGGIALLRSFVVVEAHRGQGLGGAVLAAVLDAARHGGAREAWLLTTTASDFFARHGFKPVDRVSAPGVVTASRQFASLCPTSAVLMCLKLA